MNDAELIAFCEDPKEITIADFCAREGLDQRAQKRLLGACIRFDLEDPVLAHKTEPTDEEKASPGTLRIYDDWRLDKWLDLYKQSHKST